MEKVDLQAWRLVFNSAQRDATPSGSEVVKRTNMSIHGGIKPGSRGCIDLHVNAPEFFNHLRQSSTTRAIYLTVRYPSAIKK